MRHSVKKPSAIAVIALAVFGVMAVISRPSSASEIRASQSVTLPLPVSGPFKLCLVVGSKGPKERIGKCNSAPVLERGALTVTVNGAATPPLWSVEQPVPTACDGLPGVQLNLAGVSGARVAASVSGTGSAGPFGTSISEDVSEPTDLAARVCFEP